MGLQCSLYLLRTFHRFLVIEAVKEMSEVLKLAGRLDGGDGRAI